MSPQEHAPAPQPSEAAIWPPQPLEVQPPAAQPLSAGQMLQAARQSKGVALGVLSFNLKVSERQLRALEADAYGSFRGMAFARALAQSVCKQLKIDAAPVLAALPPVEAFTTIEPAGIEARSPAHHPAPARVMGKKKNPLKVWLVAAALALVSAALILGPDLGWVDAPSTDEVAETAPPVWVPSEPASAAAAAASSPEPSASASASASVTAPALVQALPVAALVPQAPAPMPAPAPVPLPAAVPVPAMAPKPASVLPTPSPAVAALAAPAPAAAAEGELAITVTADVWIEVRDGNGQMVIKRLVKSGESVKQTMSAPFFIYVGKADQTRLLWRGKALDLTANQRGNEVRMKVAP